MLELLALLLFDFGAVLFCDMVFVDDDVELFVEDIEPFDEAPICDMPVDDDPVEGIAPGVPDCIPGMLPDGWDALIAPDAPAEPELPAAPVAPALPPAAPPACANVTAGVRMTAAARIYFNIFHSLGFLRS